MVPSRRGDRVPISGSFTRFSHPRSTTVEPVPGPPDVAEVLASVTAALPGGGEDRPGQRAMAEAVGRAIDERRHLVVGAGTGTGKSLAYLIPAVVSGRSVVVATATRALQDQLATKDLPLVAEALAGPPDGPVRGVEGPVELPLSPTGHRSGRRRGSRAVEHGAVR